MGFELYPYQADALERLRDGFRRKRRRMLLCLPTGGGKTVVSAAMIEGAVAKGKTVAFVCDRVALLDQTSLRLSEAGIPHGVAGGGRDARTTLPVQVCSAQALASRGGWPGAGPGLVIVDECHTQYKATLRLLDQSKAPVVGLTATPFARGLGKVYDGMVSPVSTLDLIAQKRLVDLKVFCATPIDMDGAPTNGSGEWAAKTVEDRALPVTGDIVAEWAKYTRREFGGPVKTLVFSATVAHGDELVGEFRRAGHEFEQVSYRSAKGAKDGSIERFRRGEITGLVSCEALAKGFDVPDALCLVSARPYRKSLTSHIQQLGRIMRSATGKEFGLVLDHAGNYVRHAEATERFWAEGASSLDDGSGKPRRRTARAEEDREAHLCGGCKAVLKRNARKCPYCGWERPARVAEVKQQAGVMVEFRRRLVGAVGDPWPQVCRYALDRCGGDEAKAMKRALAAHRNLTGRFPVVGRGFEPAAACEPGMEAVLDHDHREWLKARRREWYAARKAS